MALGKRGGVQGEFWVSAENLPKSPGHAVVTEVCPESVKRWSYNVFAQWRGPR